MMPHRLRTDFWIAALRRRAEAAGAFVSIVRRGAEEAGAVFVQVDRGEQRCDLYGPAPQSVFSEGASLERLFSALLSGATEVETRTRMEREIRFDPDLWLIDIQDRAGRPFVDLVAESEPMRFTSR
jgi:hypothetical protein